MEIGKGKKGQEENAGKGRRIREEKVAQRKQESKCRRGKGQVGKEIGSDKLES
jgi:hypothetical protein